MKKLPILSTIDISQDSNSVSFQWIVNKYEDFPLSCNYNQSKNPLCALKSLQRHLTLYMCIYNYNKYVNLHKQLKLYTLIYHAPEADAK